MDVFMVCSTLAGLVAEVLLAPLIVAVVERETHDLNERVRVQR